MPFAQLAKSPLNPEASEINIHYLDSGEGMPLLFLHGGWGYEVYPFDKQIAVFQSEFRILIPDRSGFGDSTRISYLPPDFHGCAAGETLNFMDALEIDRAILWGHSDGAVIAAKVGLQAPDRCAGIVLEALHFLRRKPNSRPFFENMAGDPDLLGEKITTILSRDHGEDWKKIILLNGDAWLRIAEDAPGDDADLYDGRLGELSVPTVVIHGELDPRTEPGELDAVRSAIGSNRVKVIEGAYHSPHSANSSFEQCNLLASEFLSSLEVRSRTAG
ncbi:MAG TPA: alpha/beta hydrolase [Blastocatellia bacterium]|nr:alpha/beta hydrolase [Blastocatellia bacterium]